MSHPSDKMYPEIKATEQVKEMQEMEQVAAVASKVLQVMEQVGAIRKTQRNTHQGYMYRGIDDLYGALQPALKSVGLLIVPRVLSTTSEVVDKTKRVEMEVEYTLIDTDTGACITASAAGEGVDKSDKAVNKAWTAAYKYFLFQLLCIPTENSVDADSETVALQPDTISAAQTKELQSIITSATTDADVLKVLKVSVKDALKNAYNVNLTKDIPSDRFSDAKTLIEETVKSVI